MRHEPITFVRLHSDDAKSVAFDGALLFYTMSGAFLSLFAFVLWYCPRHL